MTTRIKQRRDIAANWTSNNPILALGETGWETDTGRVKLGDGSTTWTNLQYAVGGAGRGIGGAIAIGTECISSAYAGCCNNSIAIGAGAGACCRSSGPSIAIGHDAGKKCQQGSAIAIGRWAGACCQEMNTVAIGRYAGQCYQNYGSVAVGKYAGNYGQSSYGVAIGYGAQQNYGSCNAIAIGHDAGRCEQGGSAISIGHEAGECCQDFRAIGIGRWAGAGCQGSQAVAVGALAGRCDQGQCAIAIGRHAGLVYQGNNAVAIGHEAGQGLEDQYQYCRPQASFVSGGGSGETTFIVSSVAGIYPGMEPQGSNLNPCTVTAVNTGTNELTLSAGTAGQLSGTYSFYGSQGDEAIAIGAYAGRSVQHDNSVIINASGNEVNSAGTGTVVIKTVRMVESASGFYPCYYNPDTGELVYFTGP